MVSHFKGIKMKKRKIILIAILIGIFTALLCGFLAFYFPDKIETLRIRIFQSLGLATFLGTFSGFGAYTTLRNPE